MTITMAISSVLTNDLLQFKDQRVCLAFSGGVDSALLLRLCKYHDIPVIAVTFHTALHPTCDLDVARETAAGAGVPHYVIEIDEFSNPKILDNPTDRCYHCKYQLFSMLKEFAKAHGCSVVMDGTNADDLEEYRPGLLALQELQVVSPLAACHITKAEVRQMAAELGMTVASRPSSPCMATRLPYGDRITREKMRQIEAGEQLLQDAGFQVVRLRVHGDLARIEVPTAALSELLEKKESVILGLRTLGFHYITLDLEGFRSGSFDLANQLTGKARDEQ